MHTPSQCAVVTDNESKSSSLHALTRSAPAAVVHSALKPAVDGPTDASLLNLHPPSINAERSQGPLFVERLGGLTQLAMSPPCSQPASPSSPLNIVEEAQRPLPTPCRALSYGEPTDTLPSLLNTTGVFSMGGSEESGCHGISCNQAVRFPDMVMLPLSWGEETTPKVN